MTGSRATGDDQRREPRRPALLRLAILLGLLAAGTGCREAAAPAPDESCFPLWPEARWTFDGRHDGRVYRYTLAARPLQVEGRRVYGFFELSPEAARRPLLGNMFGDEFFRWDGDALRVADEHHPGEEHVLLRHPLRLETTSEYRVGARVTRVRVEAREQLTVPAGTFDCYRLVVVDAYDSGQSERHAVWLAPGVGLVRWTRASGRVDELVHFSARR